MRYRRKPPEVEARAFIVYRSFNNGEELAKWCGGKYKTEVKPSDPTDVAHWVEVSFRGHHFKVRPNEYLVMAEDEWFVLSHADFHSTYEESPHA